VATAVATGAPSTNGDTRELLGMSKDELFEEFAAFLNERAAREGDHPERAERREAADREVAVDKAVLPTAASGRAKAAHSRSKAEAGARKGR
jgi:hypothetical protein